MSKSTIDDSELDKIAKDAAIAIKKRNKANASSTKPKNSTKPKPQGKPKG